MTDIIANAKRLLDGATPGPWVESESELVDELIGGEHHQSGGEPILVIGAKYWPGDNPERSEPIGYWELDDAINRGVLHEEDLEDTGPYYHWLRNNGDIALIAAAPEMAQALAEETYEYAVQAWMGGQWIMMLTSNYGSNLTHRGRWFVPKYEAEDFAEMWNRDTPTRIVRRRVSPPEVCK